jgi:uncharacterized protein involved in cysteine biosynthesis
MVPANAPAYQIRKRIESFMAQQGSSSGPAGYCARLEPRGDSFSIGFTSMFRGMGFLARSTKSWPYAVVPLAVVVLLSLLFGWAVVRFVQPWTESLIGPANDTAWWSSTLSWLAAVVAFTAGLFLAYVLAPPLSAPALEKLVESREQDMGAPPRAPRGYLWEVGAGFRAAMVAIAVTAPLWIAIWVIELFVPAVAPLTLMIKALLTSAAVSWSLLDYPLTLRGVPLRDRMRLWKRRPGLVAGFGAAFAALFWIPCFGLLMLPVGVIAAAEVSWRLMLAEWSTTGWHPALGPPDSLESSESSESSEARRDGETPRLPELP